MILGIRTTHGTLRGERVVRLRSLRLGNPHSNRRPDPAPAPTADTARDVQRRRAGAFHALRCIRPGEGA